MIPEVPPFLYEYAPILLPALVLFPIVATVAFGRVRARIWLRSRENYDYVAAAIPRVAPSYADFRRLSDDRIMVLLVTADWCATPSMYARRPRA